MYTKEQIEYSKKIQTVKPEEAFICRFIKLNNWRVASGREDFLPYYEDILGLQIKNKLYYKNEVCEIKYVYINKPNNVILEIYDEIPPDTDQRLIDLYLKEGKKLRIAEERHKKSLAYHNSNDSSTEPKNADETETV